MRIVLIACLLLVSCGSISYSQQKAYEDAVELAARGTARDTIALGLRFGMDSVRVEHWLDSLVQQHRLIGALDSTIVEMSEGDSTEVALLKRELPTTTYLNGQLAEVSFDFRNDPLPLLPVKRLLTRQLARWYGSPGYTYQEEGSWSDGHSVTICQSWLQQGIEIKIRPMPAYGVTLTYTDLSRRAALTRRWWQAESVSMGLRRVEH